VELKIGDLVKHKVHGFYGIITTCVAPWGRTLVCKVEWCESRKNHLIDINFLDKVNE